MRVDDDHALPCAAVPAYPVTLDGELLRPDDVIVLGEVLNRAHAKNLPWQASLVAVREAFYGTGVIVTEGRARTSLIDILRTDLIHRQQDAIALLLQGRLAEGHVIASRCRSLWQILRRVKRHQQSTSGNSAPSPSSPD